MPKCIYQGKVQPPQKKFHIENYGYNCVETVSIKQYKAKMKYEVMDKSNIFLSTTGSSILLLVTSRLFERPKKTSKTALNQYSHT